MGNRKIDEAFLPEGYEPVGIKEYGGVIYIAAYNPITQKGQIGSFPSPQRKINASTTEKGITLDLSDSAFETSDTILIPVTNTPLNPGDKFLVFGDLGDTSNITNYNNISGKKVISPKNKKYTLALGVLNSQNEFVDITESLYRWSTDGNSNEIEILNTDGRSLLGFNTGYFIPSTNPVTKS